MLDFSVVIPTFRRPSSLLRTVVAWLDVDFPQDRFEVVVVDDERQGVARRVLHGSSSKHSPALHILDGQRTGATAARNLGAAEASGRILVFSDDDIKVRRDHLQQQLRTRALCGNDCVVSAMWDYPQPLKERLSRSSFGRLLLGRVDRHQRCRRHVADDCWETDVVDSCNLSVERSTFERLGRWGQHLPGAGYWEDNVLGWRARRHGMRLIRNRDLLVENDEQHVSLRAVCRREEQVASAFVMLAEMMPQDFDLDRYLLATSVAGTSGSIRTMVKKQSRQLLSRTVPLELITLLGELGEHMGLSDRTLHPYFDRTMYLYAVRGIRRALR